MKLDAPVFFTVSVRKSGGDNRALVRGEGIRAGCTQSARLAAERAIDKLLQRRDWGPVDVKLDETSSTMADSTFVAAISPKTGPVKYPAHQPQGSVMEEKA